MLFYLFFKELWTVCYKKDVAKMYLPMHSMALALGSTLCKTLPAVHHLTGSDYTSKVGSKCKGVNGNPENYLITFAQGIIFTSF